MNESLENERTLRKAALVMGLATAVLGIITAIAPKGLARGVDVPLQGQPAGPALLRAYGLGDAVTGTGLAAAALGGGAIAPWLLIRTLVEGGAALAIGCMLARGSRSRALTAVGLVALAASAGEALLWRGAKRTS